MSAIQTETHVLTLNEEQEFKVVVWDDGSVDLYLDGVGFTTGNFADMVAFAELHGQITVAAAPSSTREDRE